MKKILTGCLLCLATSVAMAQNTLKKLDMWVVLQPDGSAIVGEERYSRIGDEGTEGYITFNNLGDIEVINLAVDDETGTEYILEEEWDTQRSRAEKAGRCGFNRTDKGVEICWGIGEPGERTYNIYYRLTNLVQAYDDFDGFNFSFYEAGNTPAREMRLHIIYDKDSLTRDNTAIWAFGFHGYKAIHKGYCEIVVDGPMKKGESVIILMQFQKGLFEPVSKVDGSFTETVKREAFEGSDYNRADAGLKDAGLKDSEEAAAQAFQTPEEEGTDWGLLIGIVAIVGIVGGAIWATNKDKNAFKKRHAKTITLLNTVLGRKKYDELPYYRDLPVGGNLLLSGLTVNTVNALSEFVDSAPDLKVKFNLRLLYEALILRMIYKNQVQVISSEENGELRKLFRISEPVIPEKGTDLTESLSTDSWRKTTEMGMNEAIVSPIIKDAIAQHQGLINDAGIEYQLQSLLYAAAGEDHLLQPKELETYMENNGETWRPLSIVLDLLTERILNDESVTPDSVPQVVGFLRYLKDFSLVGERNLEETGLWKEYLVFASFYGIADQVRNDMKKVAPDVAKLEGLLQPVQLLHEDFMPLTTSLYSTIRIAHHFQTERERDKILKEERKRERARSSGGSGRSSYGGGGGHRGGGGSGFR